MFTRNLITIGCSLVCMLAFTFAAQAQEYKVGDIQIHHPFARATVPGQVTGSVYVDLENNGRTEDKLVKAESPVAKSVELHTMEMTAGNVMKMREVKEIDLSAGKKISMKPGGGYHIMLIGLKNQLKAGDKLPLALNFKKAGKINIMVKVEAASAATEHQH